MMTMMMTTKEWKSTPEYQVQITFLWIGLIVELNNLAGYLIVFPLLVYD